MKEIVGDSCCAGTIRLVDSATGELLMSSGWSWKSDIEASAGVACTWGGEGGRGMDREGDGGEGADSRVCWCSSIIDSSEFVRQYLTGSQVPKPTSHSKIALLAFQPFLSSCGLSVLRVFMLLQEFFSALQRHSSLLHPPGAPKVNRLGPRPHWAPHPGDWTLWPLTHAPPRHDPRACPTRTSSRYNPRSHTRPQSYRPRIRRPPPIPLPQMLQILPIIYTVPLCCTGTSQG